MAGVAVGDFIVAFRATLQTAIDADNTFGTAGAALKVKLTGDGEAGLTEAVYLVRPDDRIGTFQEHAAIGAGRRNEELRVPCRAQIKVGGLPTDTSATFALALNRARDLMDIIVDTIRDSPPSAGDQTLRSIVEQIDYDPIPLDQGWAVEVDFDITATVRVS